MTFIIARAVCRSPSGLLRRRTDRVGGRSSRCWRGSRRSVLVGVTWENRIEIVCREDNANGARAKGGPGSVPVATALMRLYGEYMHVEYGSLDSDYVFVNLWGGRVGRPLTYATVNDIVLATRGRWGFTSRRTGSGTRMRRSAGGRVCRSRWSAS